jgi:hypothetical protein
VLWANEIKGVNYTEEEIKRRGPTKKVKPKKTVKNKNKAQLANDNGLIEVQVAFEHCSRIAQVTGFQIDEDCDAQRIQKQCEDHVEGYDPEQDDFVFEIESEDELEDEQAQ